MKKRLEEQIEFHKAKLSKYERILAILDEPDHTVEAGNGKPDDSERSKPKSKPETMKGIILDIVTKHYPLDIDGMLAKARKHHRRRFKRGSIHSALYHLRKDGFIKRVRGKKGWYQPK
jgi:hypothetical protein